MTDTMRFRGLVALLSGVTLFSMSGTALGAEPGAAEAWQSWGGPNGNFTLSVTGLADRWPEKGPPVVWRRPLGEGYSPIVSDGDTLFTMYRSGTSEVVVAIDATSGKTVWEYRYDAPVYDGQSAGFGQGPNASGLIVGNRLFTIGFTGLLHCFDIRTGKPLWSHDLVKRFDGRVHYYGYANSPMAYHDSIIVLTGGEEQGVVALNPETGNPVWRSKPYHTSYASPTIIRVGEQDQFVFFTDDHVVAVDVTNGKHLWQHPVMNMCRVNCTSAVWGDDGILWVATKGVGGTRGLKLARTGDGTEVTELWHNPKIRVFHWNALRINDTVYTSTGDSPSFLVAADIKSGKLRGRQRGLSAVNGIYADGKLIMLDHDCTLVLAVPTEDAVQIRSRADVSEGVCWTPPTLVGRTIFLRDREQIMALDLGQHTRTASSDNLHSSTAETKNENHRK